MIAIIKYNAGNATSVKNAIGRLGYESTITDDVQTLLSSEKVIFPGVGEASSAMKYLRERQLDKVITSLQQPVLGICLGQQLMCMSSEEGDTDCLGIFETRVKKFPQNDIVPHMGWNSLRDIKSGLFEGIPSRPDFYFVHSYFAEICESTTAICDYIRPFSAAMQKNNFYATQFHPEKSAGMGEKLLLNFLSL